MLWGLQIYIYLYALIAYFASVIGDCRGRSHRMACLEIYPYGRAYQDCREYRAGGHRCFVSLPALCYNCIVCLGGRLVSGVGATGKNTHLYWVFLLIIPLNRSAFYSRTLTANHNRTLLETASRPSCNLILYICLHTWNQPHYANRIVLFLQKILVT